MKLLATRKPGKASSWPRKVRVGRTTVTIYKRKTPLGNAAFMVANYAPGRRRFDSYANEDLAIEAATRLARQLSEREVVAASMTNGQAADYASAVQSLAPFGVSLPTAASTVAECLKTVGDLPNLLEAVKFYSSRFRKTEKKPVADVVAELLKVKKSRGAAPRYLQDLHSRLNRFASAFRKNTCSVTPSEVQEWLDSQKLKPQTYTNFRRVLHLLFEFAIARNFAVDNPVAKVEKIKVRGGDVAIYTPAEIARLLEAAPPEFQPCIAIGAFAGLRSAEIERLRWSDIDLAGRHITIGAARAKTASRRVVPISDNLAAWLAPYAENKGPIWAGDHDGFYEAQRTTAKAAGIAWKANALRHSYASYRFALTGDAGRVAGELGNTTGIVHRHYRELVQAAKAEAWFSVRPGQNSQIIQFSTGGH